MRREIDPGPNVLPPDHTREDYDFDYKEGVRVQIRIAGSPSMVWCKRHGWEEELSAEAGGQPS